MTSDNRSKLNETTINLHDEPKEIRLMAYKILVEKFNKKYDDLSNEQKNLIREYIENVSTTNSLKGYIQSEAKIIREKLEKKTKQITDKVLIIKLREVINLLDQYNTLKNVDENHVTALLRYYNLINDLDGVK